MVATLNGEGYDITNRECTYLRKKLSLQMRESVSSRSERISQLAQDIPPDTAPERLARIQKRCQESDELLRLKKRRVRSKPWNGIPADELGMKPRFPSEKTILASKKELGLCEDRKRYIDVRGIFERICILNGVTKKSHDADLWEKVKDDLVGAVPLLNQVYSKPPRPQKGDSLWFALDIICSDVAKKIRVGGSRMNIQEMKQALEMDPHQVVQFRQEFILLLRDAQFTSKFELSKEVWDRLKKELIARIPHLQAMLPPEVLSQKDHIRVRAIEYMCRDITKRYNDKRNKAQRVVKDRSTVPKLEQRSDTPIDVQSSFHPQLENEMYAMSKGSISPSCETNLVDGKLVLRYTDEGSAIVCYDSNPCKLNLCYAPVGPLSMIDDQHVTNISPITHYGSSSSASSLYATSAYGSSTNGTSDAIISSNTASFASTFENPSNLMSPDIFLARTRGLNTVGNADLTKSASPLIYNSSNEPGSESSSVSSNDGDNECTNEHANQPIIRSKNPFVDNETQEMQVENRDEFSSQWRSPLRIAIGDNDIINVIPSGSIDHPNTLSINNSNNLFGQPRHERHDDGSGPSEHHRLNKIVSSAGDFAAHQSVETHTIKGSLTDSHNNHLQLSWNSLLSNAVPGHFNVSATEGISNFIDPIWNPLTPVAAIDPLNVSVSEGHLQSFEHVSFSTARDDLSKIPVAENPMQPSWNILTTEAAYPAGLPAIEDFNSVLYSSENFVAPGVANKLPNVLAIEGCNDLLHLPGDSDILPHLNAPSKDWNEGMISYKKTNEIHEKFRVMAGYGAHLMNPTGCRAPPVDPFGYETLPERSEIGYLTYGAPPMGDHHLEMPILQDGDKFAPHNTFQYRPQPVLPEMASFLRSTGVGEDFCQFQNHLGGLFEDGDPFYQSSTGFQLEHNNDGKSTKHEDDQDAEYTMEYEYPDPSQFGMY